MTELTVLWRRLDRPGHESARLSRQGSYWHLTGTSVFAHQQSPCRLEYLVVCSSTWETVSGKVAGWVGNETVQLDVDVNAARRWRLNGVEHPAVAGCVDLDFGFSPSTNLLPIRRLDLAIGQRAEVAAAWLGFPSFQLERLEQVYHRTDAGRYRYQSAGGAFSAELEVNASGLVTRYPGLWQVETGG